MTSGAADLNGHLSGTGWMVIQVAGSVVATVLVVAANWQYIAEVIRREAHPRLVSWAIWAVSMGIACAGAAVAGQLPAATLAGAGSAGCLVVLVAGWRHGERDVGWLDAWCAAVGGAGAVLLAASVIWPGVVPVAAAITASVVTDASAFLPTWRNAWHGNEPLQPFVIFTVAAIVSLAVSDMTVPAAVIFPIYETAANALASLLIAASPARYRASVQQAPAISGRGDVPAGQQTGVAENTRYVPGRIGQQPGQGELRVVEARQDSVVPRH